MVCVWGGIRDQRPGEEPWVVGWPALPLVKVEVPMRGMRGDRASRRVGLWPDGVVGANLGQGWLGEGSQEDGQMPCS